MENKSSKSIQILLGIIAIVLVVIAVLLVQKNNKSSQTRILNNEQTDVASKSENTDTIVNPKLSPSVVPATQPANESTYLYRKHGFEIELPKGFIPQEIEGETGPTISIELPNSDGWLISVSDAVWWEKYNVIDQADFIRDQKVGNTLFKVYKYKDKSQEFYWFKQGNVAYIFNGKFETISKYMETFKFVGWN
jgi:hypothetical protein